MIRRRRSLPPSPIEQATRRSKWRRAVLWLGPRWLSLASALALSALSLAMLSSPLFRVEQVAVSSQSATAQEAMTRATQLSQVVGHNIFLINTMRLAREVAEVPSVLSARVVPRLPNTVEIEIVERVPIATWRTTTGAFLVDDQGSLLADAGQIGGPTNQAEFVVRDTTGRELRLGDQINRRALLAARELAAALPAVGLEVREVEYSAQGLVLLTSVGWRVIFGETDALNAKLANLSAIVEMARAQQLAIALVDLRPKDRPFYQLAAN